MVRHTNFLLLWRGALRLVLLVALAGATECVVMGGYTFEGYHAPGIGTGGSAGSRAADGGCIPLSCADLGASCGQVSDGCGDTVQCGACVSPDTCGGGGMSKKCGCTPSTCPELGADCGMISDGCGQTLDCGTCVSPRTCGGTGVPNRCGCAATTCAAQNADCGMLPDGCGGTID